ncbi:hypothetical protein K470DRAFT_197172, partial [Piedraia hortae CBS 480.64]
ALLTELAGATPTMLLDDIINTVNGVIYVALNAVEDGLKGTPAEQIGFAQGGQDGKALRDGEVTAESMEEAKNDEIANGMVRLETLLNSSIDRTMDRFEIYTARNILTVGDEGLLPYVVLDHYR